MKQYNVAVVGASGAVGEEILRVFEEIDFPMAKMIPLASARSAGNTVDFNGEELVIQELTETVFEEEGIEIALFSAGGSVSAKYAPHAAAAGAVVIDNTSHFRMDADVPLVVPEVNPEDIALWKKKGIIANPNCSTIQMLQALKPLDDAFDLLRVDVATYQATSGAGKSAMEELVMQVPVMPVEELHRRLERGDSPNVLDVRQDAEWVAGHIPQAIHVEGGRLPTGELPLPKDSPVVVHCGHGDRSTVGISVLERRGYRNLVLLDGGFAAWETAGYEVARGHG